MKKNYLYLLLILTPILHAKSSVQNIIDTHYQKYSKTEYFSAIQVSIKTPKSLETYVTGRKKHGSRSPKIDKSSLFTIGSITKSFTASLMLIAEREKKLLLAKTLGDYLKLYSHWKNISMTSLLNMSSGLPNYSDTPSINYAFDTSIEQTWDSKQLINLVYNKDFNPPLKQGYFYSNTGYILSEMVLENRYQKSFKNLLSEKIIKPLALKNTYYPIPEYEKAIKARVVHGYGYNVYDNPELVGRDVSDNNLSWAASAGGIVANSEDVVHWVEALFTSPSFLMKDERKVLQQMISVKTGKPIKQTTADDPRGFGLGVIQNYDKNIGRFWFYQGETLGYRALYLYKPCNGVIISALFNSAVNGENDHAGELMMKLYQELVKTSSLATC